MLSEAIVLVTQIVPGLFQLFTSTFIPVATQLLKFTLPRISRIPLYLRLLWTIYRDNQLGAESRKYLTAILLILGSILSFIVYSYIPFTAVPIVGMFTTPVAAMLSLVVSLVSLDCILGLNREYLVSKYPEEFELVDLDIAEISKTLGKSWEKMVKQTQALLDSIKSQIDPNGNYDDTLFALINSLISYLDTPPDNGSLTQEEINHRIVTEGLPPVAKISGSVAEGVTGAVVTGTTAHGIAASMFVQTGFWTSIKSAVGLTSGIAVSASAYSLLTVAAPLGLAVITGAGVCHGAMQLRNEGEKRKLSAFLADVLIASLPMAAVDGDFSSQERDTLEKLLLNSGINNQDAERVRQAMNQPKTFEEILNQGLLKEKEPQKARLKHRLLLCTAWELAKADSWISPDEIDLHNRMAKITDISEKEIDELRRLILLKSGINIRDRISVIQGDITQQSVDAVVNSASTTLLPGNKWSWLPLSRSNNRIDAVIHRAAGSELQKVCQSLKHCDVGEAKITKGYNLKAAWIIHTVSPILVNSNSQEPKLLAQCYRSTLTLAHEHAVRTLAFPALGTGTGKFPAHQAARVAVTEVQQFLNTHFNIESVQFVCLNEQTYQIYVEAVEEIMGAVPTNRLEGAMPG